jgi:hypothetical protein
LEIDNYINLFGRATETPSTSTRHVASHVRAFARCLLARSKVCAANNNRTTLLVGNSETTTTITTTTTTTTM